jgi:Uma2 family endonuclease
MPSTAKLLSELETRRVWRFSVDDYQRMGEAGIFEGKSKVELIDGQIISMSPLTPEHNYFVDEIAEFFTIQLYKKAKIRTQGSIRLDQYSEPEPDICILRLKNNYRTNHALPEDVYLIIEVAVTTKSSDRTIKYQKYAQAGIPEYWIVLPEEGIIEVYSQPKGEVYLEKRTYQKEDEWTFQAFDLQIKGQDLLV